MKLMTIGVMLAITPALSRAQIAVHPNGDTTTTVTFGGYVDTYYAFDFNRPKNFDRSFTTQPARHDEFNVNLAFIDAKLESPRTRGRLAIQYGTSVQANYAGEPTHGTVSGSDVSRFLQEAYVGIKVARNVWIDGGIFFSHIGSESWISRDNPNYTRSLAAEYSPYYQSGVRATWQATPKLSAQLAVVNGWQVISANTQGKSVGLRLDYAIAPAFTTSYWNYVGPQPGSLLRIYNGGSVKWAPPNGRNAVIFTADYGNQELTAGGHGQWYDLTLIAQRQLTDRLSVAARVERYDDPKQVVVSTGVADPFRTTGGSLSFNYAVDKRVLWRTAIRGFSSTDRVWPSRTAPGGFAPGNGFVVTSLALSY